jgi:hypothetical protein
MSKQPPRYLDGGVLLHNAGTAALARGALVCGQHLLRNSEQAQKLKSASQQLTEQHQLLGTLNLYVIAEVA